MADNFSFGYWLRRQRLAHDLRQADLARQLGVAPITLRKIEADDRRPSLQLVARVAALFALSDEERVALLRVARADLSAAALPLPASAPMPAAAQHDKAGIALEPAPASLFSGTATLANLPADVPPQRTLHPRLHNLPAQTTVWIGREAELVELCALLRQPEIRLITLIGPGGTGKTRLALQAGAELFEQFPQGVWFVNLASVTEPALVISAIAQTLDIREQGGQGLAETVCSALREQKLLLLLDNFEQVIAAVGHVAQLLAEAAQLTILVTSREALHLSGEQQVSVAPLAVPDPHQLAKPGEELALLVGQYDAVRLFSDRARAVRSDFTLTAANALAVAGICTRLDGLPLAIELAAVHLGLFSPAALLVRLNQRHQLLSSGLRDLPARQQTLRGTIEWSYALLTDAEQRFFRHLAVFVDGWTIAGAAAVTERTENESLERLTALVDKSLLRHTEGPDGEPRFTMLQTIREYAVEQLAQHDEAAPATGRHAAYFLQLALGAEAHLRDSEAQLCMAQLEAEHANLRAALQWYQTQAHAEQTAQLCVALCRFWFDRGLWREGQEAVAPVLAEEVLVRLPPQLQAGALLCAGLFAARQSVYDQARSSLERGLSLYRQIGAYGEQADALFGLSIVAHGRSDYAQAAGYLREAAQCSRAANDRFRVALYLGWLGYMTQILGNLAEAQALAEESLQRFRELGNTDQVGVALSDLGFQAYARGELPKAVALLEEGVSLLRQSGNRYQLSTSLHYLAQATAGQRHLAPARGLYAESLALRRSMGDRRGLVPVLICMARATAALGDLQGARGELREALSIAREIAYNQGYAWVLLCAAHLVSRSGEAALAARLLGAEEALRERCSLPLWPSDEPHRAEVAGVCRATLSDGAFAAAWGAGRLLTLEESLSFAQRA